MANIQPRAPTVLSSFGAALSFSNETHPPIPQFDTLPERNRDEGAHVLHRERRCRDATLALVHLALSREHANTDQAGDEGARLPGLLVYGRVLHDVSKGDGVESEETVVPLYADEDASKEWMAREMHFTTHGEEPSYPQVAPIVFYKRFVYSGRSRWTVKPSATLC